MVTPPDALEALRAENDLYRRLLGLGAHDDLGAFLDEALSLAARAVGAERGVILLDPEHPGAKTFRVFRGCSETEAEALDETLSRGIVAEALASGRTVSTANAWVDARFAAQASVQGGRIGAVLCAPIAGARRGVVYLHGRPRPGPFSEQDRRLIEAFAAQIAPRVEGLGRAGGSRVDATASVRARLRCEAIVGQSPSLAESLRRLAVAAASDLPVLLRGETGTGKSEMAACLHHNSARQAGPFVTVACGSMPETLLEGELFGHERGAHSTAHKARPGLIEAAHQGTLFFDEIDALPLALQPKLLELIQRGTYRRLGSNAEREARCRFVVATNIDLAASAEQNSFRRDLYYRLNVHEIALPPLRARREDIVPIARATAAREGDLKLSSESERCLVALEWPGNIRELRNTVLRGVHYARFEGTPKIEPWQLFPDLPRAPERAQGGLGWAEATRQFQRQLLVDTVASTQGNVSEAARVLGLSRSHLHEVLRAFGVDPRAR